MPRPIVMLAFSAVSLATLASCSEANSQGGSPADSKAMRSCMKAHTRAECECIKGIFPPEDFAVVAQLEEIEADETLSLEVRKYRVESVASQLGMNRSFTLQRGWSLAKRQCNLS